jgi:GNAT superfamily N-acetyltransferase
MDARALIRLEAELEYGVVLRGDIIPVTPENTRDVPLVTVARFADGYELLYRDGLPDAERARFGERCAASLFAASPDTFDHRIIDCRWYVITRIPEPTEFPDVTERDGHFVVERNGRVVADAWSSQDAASASEVEVETQPDYQRRGYGRQVVAAWAHRTRRASKTAFYSHLTANDASRALAASVGAMWFADTREFFPKTRG